MRTFGCDSSSVDALPVLWRVPLDEGIVRLRVTLIGVWPSRDGGVSRTGDRLSASPLMRPGNSIASGGAQLLVCGDKKICPPLGLSEVVLRRVTFPLELWMTSQAPSSSELMVMSTGSTPTGACTFFEDADGGGISSMNQS